MTPQEFVHKWKRANLSERSAYQQHFLDLCDLLNQPKPATADPDGAFYTFERGVSKMGGGRGWADVWLRGHFAWEYKKKHKDLVAAYAQLQLYRDDLDNPPLLVVCDLDRFEVHTNFTNTAKQLHSFNLDQLVEPARLDLLKKVFTNPEALKPEKNSEDITQDIAEKFAALADNLRTRKIDPHRTAHFLMKLMFCMFAEDIGLLENKLFARLLDASRPRPGAPDPAAALSRRLKNLFEAMADGGEFGADLIRHFNGGLFKEADVIDLTWNEIEVLIQVNNKDWNNVEPSIFGTLFERLLDPAKRSQIGAHYTSRADILTLLEPVLMAPLRREWEQVKTECLEHAAQLQEAIRQDKKAQVTRARKAFDDRLNQFLHRLATVKILDPACGSGNFLYVAINLLLDLEKQVIAFGSQYGFTWHPHVRPTQLLGIEINPFAQELAQVVIWIGYLQWMLQNGFSGLSEPILEPFENIKNMDAILDLSDPENPKEPEWPEAEFIVGNPPFLGGSRVLEELGKEYQQKLWRVYQGRVAGASDLCCYWFEKAREYVKEHKECRVGLLATQSIRGGVNRDTIAAIKESSTIFFAVSDRDWILDGAMVHVSMIGFGSNLEQGFLLDGKEVNSINANLTGGADTTTARPLAANQGLSFIGPKKAGSFNIPLSVALDWLPLPNPHAKPNSDVLVPWINGATLVNQLNTQWIIDAGDLSLADFSLYEGPYRHVLEHVKPDRDKNKERRTKENWWLFKRTAPELREWTKKLPRLIATVRHAKHRIFAWVDPSVVCDDGIFLFVSADDFFFGVLQSRVHEVWAMAQGTQVRERESGFRYTPTTCFETFPFPEPTDAQRQAIADAAKELDQLRTQWLNPPEWTKQEILEFPGTTTGPWARYVHDPNLHGTGTVRYPRLIPRHEEAAELLAKRTLTNLYNERPTWLDLAHQKLDAAVATAYGWPAELPDEEILARLLKLNLERATEPD